MLQPTLRPILQLTLLLTPQATSPTIQIMLLAHNQMSLQFQGKMRELSLHQHKPIMLKEANVDA
jgi:hypothetical protein